MIDSEAKSHTNLNENSGLPSKAPQKGLAADSPLGQKILMIINSEEGIKSMIELCIQGQPSLIAIDLKCQELFGDEYKNQHDFASNVGYWVTRKMRELGYYDDCTKPTRPDCLIKEGLVFRENEFGA